MHLWIVNVYVNDQIVEEGNKTMPIPNETFDKMIKDVENMTAEEHEELFQQANADNVNVIANLINELVEKIGETQIERLLKEALDCVEAGDKPFDIIVVNVDELDGG